jgi:hypothetical protein
MIDVKQAVKNALEYVGSIFPAGEMIDPRLEEIELTQDEKSWLITVSFIRKTPPQSVLQIPNQLAWNINTNDREYKLITLSAESGKPLSMKIRQLV